MRDVERVEGDVIKGLIRPCRHRLGPELQERWQAHLCGLCLRLRDEAGQSARVLTGYDALALRQLRLKVPYRITALASFTSYAVSFTLGFPLLTAGTIRYWIYSRHGLSAAKIAALTVIAWRFVPP